MEDFYWDFPLEMVPSKKKYHRMKSEELKVLEEFYSKVIKTFLINTSGP